MRSGVVAVALLACLAVAAAQDFPYGRCARARSKSPYGITQTSSNDRTGEYCWTFDYGVCKTTGDYCCTAKLDKFMLDVNPECQGTTGVTATLDGVALRNVKVEHPPNFDDASTLYVPDLNLAQAQAEGKTLCIKLQGRCNTLSKFITGDSWQVALWDDQHRCCPVYKNYAPPPLSPGKPPASPIRSPPPRSPVQSPPPRSPRVSPPPRTPRAPPPPPTCKTCWIWRIEPNPSAGATFPLRPPSTYFSVKANCDYAKAELDKVFDGFRANGLIKSGFTSYSCRSNAAYSCGEFRSVDAAQQAISDAGSLDLLLAVPFRGGSECPLDLVGYQRILTTEKTYGGETDLTCGPANIQACSPPPPPPFPTCKCLKKYRNTPFSLKTEVDFKETTCFPVEIVEPKTRTFCGNTTVLDKVEFYLDWAQRKEIKSVYVKTTRGRIPKMPNWGKPTIDTFKIGNLAWSVSDVRNLKPEVCFVVAKGKTILDLVPNRSPMIYWSLFDPSQNCCPTYYSM